MVYIVSGLERDVCIGGRDLVICILSRDNGTVARAHAPTIQHKCIRQLDRGALLRIAASAKVEAMQEHASNCGPPGVHRVHAE